VDADPDRLAQILDNLLRNAMTFTDTGGTITMKCRREGDQGLLIVRDTGEGMEPEEIAGLFEPYRQADRRRRSDGLGLGLTLVKRLVELHGGSVTARSDGVGLGSEFRLTLPIADAEASAVPPKAGMQQPAAHRILVVDDQPDVADTLALLLEELGQEVTVAYDGTGALEAALELRPQVALLDLAMPDMNGYELAARLRQRFADDELMLVALTGHGSKTASLKESGFQRYLLKPAEADALAALLGSIP